MRWLEASGHRQRTQALQVHPLTIVKFLISTLMACNSLSTQHESTKPPLQPRLLTTQCGRHATADCHGMTLRGHWASPNKQRCMVVSELAYMTA